MKYFFATAIALVPGLFWAWYWLRQDTKNPEPLKLLGKVFLWGALATLPAIAIEYGVDFFTQYSQTTSFGVIVVSTLFVVAPVEELLKFFVIKELVARNPEFDEPIDAIIYAILAALGFATFENALVALSAGQDAVVLRFATATLLHAITTGIVGYHIAIARFGTDPKKGIVTQGILIAIVLHALYNIVASTNTPFTIPIIAVLLISMFIVLTKGIREVRNMPIPPPNPPSL